MTTAFDAFRCPRQFPNFVPYYGPPKPKPARRGSHKRPPSTPNERANIDRILETGAGPKAALEGTGPLTPTKGTAKSWGLQYFENEGGEDYISAPKERLSQTLIQEGPLEAPNVEGIDASLNYLFEDNSPEYPVVIEDDPADESLEISVAADNPAYSITGEEISPAIPQHLVSLGDDGGVRQDNVLWHKMGPNDDADVASPSLSTKRKRSQSADTDTSISQLSDSTSRQCNDNALSAKRSKHLSSSSNSSVSGCTSTPKPAPLSPRNDTNPQICNNKSPESTVRPAQLPSYRHHSEELHMDNNGDGEIVEDGVGADNGTCLEAAVAIRQPDLNNSHQPKEKMTEGGFPRDAAEDHADSESERPRSKSKGQPAKRRRFRFTNRKSHPTSVPEYSRRRFEFTASHTKGRFLSPLPPRSAFADARAPSDCDGIGRWSNQTPQKLAHIMLRPVSTSVSFLATIIQDDRNVPTFSYSQSLTLIESELGNAGHIDSVTIIPLTLNSWLLTGFLRTLHGKSGLAVSRTAMKANGTCNDSESDTRTLRSKAAKIGAIHSMEDERSSEDDDDSSDNDVDLSYSRWSLLDDDRLLAYKREGRPWNWIFCRFPRRTEGAVRTRWHMLRGKA